MNKIKIDRKRIINYEVMGGWPIIKMNIREIIEEFGGQYNKETGNWEIKESDVLDVCPVKLCDDGMGYGVDKEYITEVSVRNDENGKYFCNIFVDEELENIEIWKKYNIFPGFEFMLDGIDYYFRECIKLNDEYVFVVSECDNINRNRNITEKEIIKILKKEK